MDERFSAWIGRGELRADIASAAQVAGLAALLDDAAPAWREGELPPLAHWLHFRSETPQSLLGDDGHVRRDEKSMLPPVDLPRRMWAGGRLAFLAPIPIGAAMTRRTSVRSITSKAGRSGPMVWVTLDHEISVGPWIAIREQQDLVYRAPADAPPAVIPPAPGGAAALPAEGAVRRITPDVTQLFRYSALTFNAHRIHYDRDYARDVEGYPGLVVHGPYIATLLLAHALRQRTGPVRSFSFRANSPAFDGEALDLRLTGTALEARNSVGVVCMSATVEVGA